jgi:CTP:phosphocholine cytidylyltransferase-like protein
VKAIILAAGGGTRLKVDIPKCLICINGKSILDHIVEKLHNIGIKDVYAIVGSNSDKIKSQVVKYRHNIDWYHTEDLYSLMVMKKELNDDIIVIHSDIIFDESILSELSSANGNINAVYDNGKFAGLMKISKKFINNLVDMQFEPKTTIEDILSMLDEGIDIDKIDAQGKVYNIDTQNDLKSIGTKYKVTL